MLRLPKLRNKSKRKKSDQQRRSKQGDAVPRHPSQSRSAKSSQKKPQTNSSSRSLDSQRDSLLFRKREGTQDQQDRMVSHSANGAPEENQRFTTFPLDPPENSRENVPVASSSSSAAGHRSSQNVNHSGSRYTDGPRGLSQDFGLMGSRDFVGSYDSVLDGFLADIPDMNFGSDIDPWDLTLTDHESNIPPRDSFSGPARSHHRTDPFDGIDWDVPASFSDDIFRDPVNSRMDTREHQASHFKHIRPSYKRERSSSQYSLDEFPVSNNVADAHNGTRHRPESSKKESAEARGKPQGLSRSLQEPSGIVAVVQLPRFLMPSRWRDPPGFRSCFQEVRQTSNDPLCATENRICKSAMANNVEKSIDYFLNCNRNAYQRGSKIKEASMAYLWNVLAEAYSRVHICPWNILTEKFPTSDLKNFTPVDVLCRTVKVPAGGKGIVPQTNEEWMLKDVMIEKGSTKTPLLESAEYLDASDPEIPTAASARDPGNSSRSMASAESLSSIGAQSPHPSSSSMVPLPSSSESIQQGSFSLSSTYHRPRSYSSSIILQRYTGLNDNTDGEKGRSKKVAAELAAEGDGAFTMSTDPISGNGSVQTNSSHQAAGLHPPIPDAKTQQMGDGYRLHKEADAAPILVMLPLEGTEWFLTRIQWNPIPEIQIFDPAGTSFHQCREKLKPLISWLDCVHPLPNGWLNATVEAASFSMREDTGVASLLFAEKCCQGQYRQDIDAWTEDKDVRDYRLIIQEYLKYEFRSVLS
eukprot:gb/GECG01012368.1/.p1 GENE.gb/GECG01012368.1/~~gb/GECG01012368.1/.p1  ORF type:complete len:752 (+),score=88.61 gb/GECG01012368.1/:1-2256(+)